MTVVINEFEVVPEPQPTQPNVSVQAPPSQLTPREVEQILQRHHDRCIRVRAH